MRRTKEKPCRKSNGQWRGTSSFADLMERNMKAILEDHVIADSDDIVEAGGYHYFPRSSVRMDWLEKAEKTEKDRACPHGVQFYDVVIDGRRHARAAWVYEAPRAALTPVEGRFGFWQDVQVG
jgi:uncharacterized protein (DUF427 family)